MFVGICTIVFFRLYTAHIYQATAGREMLRIFFHYYALEDYALLTDVDADIYGIREVVHKLYNINSFIFKEIHVVEKRDENDRSGFSYFLFSMMFEI